MKKRILQGIGGAGLFFLAIATLVGVGQISFGGTVTKPHTFSAGQTIKSSEINANFDGIYNEFNGSVSNANISASAAIGPTKIDDYSATVSQMQTTVDPGDVGTESQATSLQGEIERLRFKVKQIMGKAQWYSDPTIAYTDAANTFTANQRVEKANAEIIVATSGKAPVRLLNRGWDAANVSFNASYDGANWNRDDTGKIARLFVVGGTDDDTLSILRVAAGANPITWTPLVVFDNTGKLTGGTVPLARVGASFDVTFGSTVDGGTATASVTHGLGTDDVTVIVRGGPAFGSKLSWVYPDAQWAAYQVGTGTGLPVVPTTPSSGNINFGWRNESGGTTTATFKVDILRRS